MIALLLTIASLFGGNTFSTTYNTKCYYTSETSIQTCSEESGQYVFVYNVNSANDIKFYNNGDVNIIKNTGMIEKYHTMNDGTNSEIIGCLDWDWEDCRLQHGNDFTRITFKELDLIWYFYNK
jgi:hypothetical protein